ncbi:MAG: formylglycine-generating enzyme family protein [Pseudomonadota bacterium]
MWRRAVMVIIAAAAGGAFYGWWSGRVPAAHPAAQVGNCKLPPTSAEHPGMVFVPGAEFTMGSNHSFLEEGPEIAAKVTGFWMDQTEVTNAQFAEFVAATGYLTLAERGIRESEKPDAPTMRGSAVFLPRGDAEAMRSFVNWWQFVAGADWHHPAGPGTTNAGFAHPVVHVAYEDALAYAKWKGRTLPTEEQFERAAQGAGRKNASGKYAANTWQGSFPSLNTNADGYAGTSPVGCFDASPAGLYDLIGNVWEWTTSPYYDRHDFADKKAHPLGFDPTQPDEQAVAVLKGGSYLCSPDYCMRYRPEARIGQSRGLGASHIGFRTVLNP